MIKRFFILLLAIVASVGMSYALTPRSGDSWDDNTKTLTVNSNPQDDHYHDQSEIKRLVISSSVTEIGEQAFSSSYNLESVIAYNGLQVIDQDAFFSCPKLESVILPSTLREVRYSAFAACDKLKYVTINAPSLEEYQEYAFDDAHENLKIYVPEASLATYKTNWSAYADKFQAIPSSLAVGDTLKVGDAMYSATDVYVDAGYLRFQIKASSLHAISAIAPNGNGKIKVEFTPYAEEFYPSGSYAALTNWIYCPSEYTSGDVTEITVVSGAGTLADPFVIDYVQPAAPAPANSCGDGLTWELNGGVLTISYDGVGTGEMYDFGYEYDANPVNVAPWKENKSDITTVVIGDGVKSIGNHAFNDLSEKFTAVTIANSVERIGLNAFLNAEEITEITLPSSLNTIDEQGFANCGFTSITIPSGVTSIGYRAFCYCRALTSLTCEATTPPTLAEGVFYKIRSSTSSISSIPLYVPSESVAAYQAADQWNAFNVQAIPAAQPELAECGLGWLNVPEGGVVGIIGHEDEIVLPQVNASQDFILAYKSGTVSLRLGSTDESVLAVYGFNNFAVNGVGECDVYVVHDEDAVFAYDSAAFHVTVNPEPTPGPAPTVWTALKVGDVIKVGDKIEVPNEGDGSWGINGNVLKNAWGPYTLIRADIYQASDFDDPVVTETEDGAFYVFKAEKDDFYPLSYLGKSGGLVVTMTSDGLVVTAAENKEFTVAVHEKSDTPTAVENVQGNKEQAVKLFRNGQLYIQREGVLYTVQGARVR